MSVGVLMHPGKIVERAAKNSIALSVCALLESNHLGRQMGIGKVGKFNGDERARNPRMSLYVKMLRPIRALFTRNRTMPILHPSNIQPTKPMGYHWENADNGFFCFSAAAGSIGWRLWHLPQENITTLTRVAKEAWLCHKGPEIHQQAARNCSACP